jgi:hypothetical protein
MIISANQPLFAPFTGFFSKACLSDTMVILDEVQFPRGSTWITRNRFKNDGGTLWITIPVWRKGLGLQRINEVRVCPEGNWRRKHLESLKTSYAHAPYFRDHVDFLAEALSGKFDRLIDLNMSMIRYLQTHLMIDTPLIMLSDLGILLIYAVRWEHPATSPRGAHRSISTRDYSEKPAFTSISLTLLRPFILNFGGTLFETSPLLTCCLTAARKATRSFSHVDACGEDTSTQKIVSPGLIAPSQH